MKYISAYGNTQPQLMILTDCPTERDVANDTLLNDSNELNKILLESGISRGNCWISAVSKYHVPPNAKGKKIPFAIRAKQVGIDIPECLNDLQKEINEIKPNCILGLGGTPLWALTGKTSINNYRGSIMQGMGRKFVPTYNPAQLSWQAADVEFIGYWNRQVIAFDVRRAHTQSNFAELKLPRRTLHVAKNSYELDQFYTRYRNRNKVSIDIEAGGHCVPICMGIAFDKSHGITIPLWNTDGISTIPTVDLVNCWTILAHILNDHEVIGQNFNYDRDKIRRLGFKVRRLYSDTMLKSFAINPELPKRLAFNQSIYTEEPFYKDEGMYQGSIEDLLLGCARDACVTYEIDENMEKDLIELEQQDFYYNYLMKLPELYLSIENQGFAVDSERREELLKKYIMWDEKLRYELFHLIGAEVNVNSPKQVALLLYENFKLPFRKGTGEEEITALLNSPKVKDETQRRVMELILEDRRVRKSISTYLMAMPDYDGRMRTTYFPCLETGRSSTGQQDPPIRPTIEVRDENNKKIKKVMGIAFQTMTKHGDIGADIRSMYIPDKDEIFIQADSSQAEARVVFLLAEMDLGIYDNHDVHALTASWFFGGNESDYSKRNLGYESPIRFAGKTLRHAGHLGAGKKRAATELNTQARKYSIPITITEAIADKALKIFHQKSPNIQQVFHNGIIKSLQDKRQLVSPMVYGFKSKYGGKRTFYERWGDELFRQAFSYIPQRSVSDNTKGAALRIRKRLKNVKIVMEAHDALLFSIPTNHVEDYVAVIREEMERPIIFENCSLSRADLTIPCDIEIGENYCDFKKFKVP